MNLSESFTRRRNLPVRAFPNSRVHSPSQLQKGKAARGRSTAARESSRLALSFFSADAGCAACWTFRPRGQTDMKQTTAAAAEQFPRQIESVEAARLRTLQAEYKVQNYQEDLSSNSTGAARPAAQPSAQSVRNASTSPSPCRRATAPGLRLATSML